MSSSFDFGDRVLVEVGFVGDDGAPADPTTVRWRVRQPDDSEALVATLAAPWAEVSAGGYTARRAGVGAFELEWAPTLAGDYVARAEGLGAVQQAVEVAFRVLPPRVRTAAVS